MELKWIIQRRFGSSIGDGRIQSEWPTRMDRNQWLACVGMGGRNESESVAGMRRNMQVRPDDLCHSSDLVQF